MDGMERPMEQYDGANDWTERMGASGGWDGESDGSDSVNDGKEWIHNVIAITMQLLSIAGVMHIPNLLESA